MVATRRITAALPPLRPDRHEVVAAGAVVLHDGRVLLVHRPKYDDWAFPKGKQDPGELELTTAVREVLEETGVEIRLGRPVDPQRYRLSDGRTKVVHYWRGEVVGDPDVSRYVPNEEIDKVAWVPSAKVRERLSYPRDLLVLDDAMRHPKAATVLVVLRHGRAVRRKTWKKDDRLRPLTRVGVRQSRELPEVLSAYGVTRVVTSASTRCQQTVLPYVREHVLEISPTSVLTEEHPDSRDVAALVGDLLVDPEPTVLCTHRPVLPTVLDRLGLEDVEPLKPGEALVVHHRKGRVRGVERHLAL